MTPFWPIYTNQSFECVIADPVNPSMTNSSNGYLQNDNAPTMLHRRGHLTHFWDTTISHKNKSALAFLVTRSESNRTPLEAVRIVQSNDVTMGFQECFQNHVESMPL